MKQAAVYFMLLATLTACSSNVKPVNFTFYNANGEAYASNTAGLAIKKTFKLDHAPTLVVIATSSRHNRKYREQINVLSRINAEEMRYLHVVANSEAEDRSGYYVRKPTAEKLLSGDSFKIMLYDELGNTLKESTEVIGETNLIHYLTKDKSKH